MVARPDDELTGPEDAANRDAIPHTAVDWAKVSQRFEREREPRAPGASLPGDPGRHVSEFAPPPPPPRRPETDPAHESVVSNGGDARDAPIGQGAARGRPAPEAQFAPRPVGAPPQPVSSAEPYGPRPGGAMPQPPQPSQAPPPPPPPQPSQAPSPPPGAPQAPPRPAPEPYGPRPTGVTSKPPVPVTTGPSPSADQFAPRQRSGSQQPPAPEKEKKASPVLGRPETEGFRRRWPEIKAIFVDDPKQSVRQADALVNEVTQLLMRRLNEERSRLEADWNGRGESSTEDLRLALHRYQLLFDRLTSA
jgi:hypothetical protein